jgi:anti-anti-sigma regulatory factor
MHWSMEQDAEQKEVLLRLSGALTVENAGELRNAFLAALATATTVTVDLGEVQAADIAGLQMFCSAHRTSLAGGKKLFFNRRVPEAFRQAVETAGLLRSQGCSLNPRSDCLWTGENLS